MSVLEQLNELCLGCLFVHYAALSLDLQLLEATLKVSLIAEYMNYLGQSHGNMVVSARSQCLAVMRYLSYSPYVQQDDAWCKQ